MSIRTSLAFVTALGGCGWLHAQEPLVPLGFTFGPGETVTTDSNFFRSSGLPGTAPIISDTAYITDLMGTFHQIYSREEVTASATIGRVLYEHQTQYDLTEQDIHGAVQSNLPYNIDATVGVSHTVALAHFADLGNTERDVISHNTLNATVDFPLVVDWRGVLGGIGAQVRNSAVAFQSQDINFAEANGGIRFQPITGNHIDLLLRTVNGSYPDSSPTSSLGPSFHQQGADLRADWTFTGESHLLGRAGFVKQTNDNVLYVNSTTNQVELLNRDFSGPAYDLTYIWQISAASRLTAYALRQTGAAGDNTYLSAITKTFRITPAYQASAKIELNAHYEWTQRNYFSNVYQAVNDQPPGTNRLDTGHNAGINVLWNPWRWLQATLDVHRVNWGSSIATYAYTDNIVSLSVQGKF